MEEYRKLLEETVNVNTGRGRKPSTVRNYLYMLNCLSNQLTKNDIGARQSLISIKYQRGAGLFNCYTYPP